MDLYTIRQQLNMGINLHNIPLRVTDYARVSTDHLEQKKSLQNQIEHFDEYIKQNKNWTYVKGYKDEGITGTSDIKRENFMRMIQDAKNGKFDLIITKEISRFSRNTLDSIKYTRELLNYGVAVLFVSDNINTALPDSELRLTIMASMAQDEIRRLSERVKFGMNRAIERGEILGNNQLYGYQKDKETGKLKIVEPEAKIVKYIFNSYVIEKKSISQIVKELNGKEILTAQGKSWSISTVSRMIRNPKYKGYYCGRKSEVTDYMNKKIKHFQKEEWITYEDHQKIPPMIPEIIWEKANQRLTKKTKNTSKKNWQNRYWYSNKIYCKEHQCLFHHRIFLKNKRDTTWVCSEYLKNGKKVCNTPNIRESELNHMIKDCFLKLSFQPQDIVKLLQKCYEPKEKKFQIQKAKYMEEKEKLTKKKAKLLDLFLEEKITKLEFEEKNNKINDQLNHMNQEYKKLETQNDKQKDQELKSILNDFITWENIFSILIDQFIKKIVATKNKQQENNIELDIYFNYKLPDIKIFEEKMTYTFLRGYDTKGTKRYQVIYQVSFHLSP